MALGFTVENIVMTRFSSYLNTPDIPQAEKDKFVSDMVGAAGSEIQAQIDEVENLYSSAVSQVNSLNASASAQMGNLATIIANTANTMAASASPSMSITLISNVSGLGGQIDGVNDTLTSLLGVIRGLGMGIPSPVTTLASSIGAVKSLIGTIPV